MFWNISSAMSSLTLLSLSVKVHIQLMKQPMTDSSRASILRCWLPVRSLSTLNTQQAPTTQVSSCHWRRGATGRETLGVIRVDVPTVPQPRKLWYCCCVHKIQQSYNSYKGWNIYSRTLRAKAVAHGAIVRQNTSLLVRDVPITVVYTEYRIHTESP